MKAGKLFVSSSNNNSHIYVGLVNLGCAKNLVDAEEILGKLYHAGFSITNNTEKAHIIIVNSCGFILPARRETIDTINEMNRYRKEGNLKMLIVSGCMAGSDRFKLIESGCKIDAFLPPFQPEAIVDLIRNGTVAENNSGFYNCPHVVLSENRIITSPGTYAYVKIADGCNNHCAYCRIPYLRGLYRSKTPDNVLDEIRSLLDDGIKEINLISQDNTLYGSDLGISNGLGHLIRQIEAIPGNFWVRLLYLHPDRVDEQLIETIGESSKFCRYLDMPIQHVSRRILSRMNRNGDPRSIREKLKMIRNTIPESAIRTTLITGYPGERDEDFTAMIDLVAEGWFDHLGVFSFYPEPNTAAESIQCDVSAEISEERRAELIELQTGILKDSLPKMVGREISLIVDFKDPDYPEYTVVRSEFQAPEVDSIVLIKGDLAPETGFIKATISDVTPSEWYAENTSFIGD